VPAAYRTPTSVSASSGTSVSARPTIANRLEARLVRRDQTETASAAIVVNAHAATVAPLAGPQWCAQRNEAKSSAADDNPRTAPDLPRLRGCSPPASSFTALPSIVRSTPSDGSMKPLSPRLPGHDARSSRPTPWRQDGRSMGSSPATSPRRLGPPGPEEVPDRAQMSSSSEMSGVSSMPVIQRRREATIAGNSSWIRPPTRRPTVPSSPIARKIHASGLASRSG